MKTMITLYALAMLAVIGIGLYHAPAWLLWAVGVPVLAIIAAGVLSDYRRARKYIGGEQ